MTRLIRSIGLASALVLTLGCVDSASEREERLAQLRNERQVLLSQFSSVQDIIRNVQRRALEEPNVRRTQEAFNETLRQVIERDDPEAVDLLDRAKAVGRDLESMANPILLQEGQEDPRPSTPEERAEVAAELAQVERELRPVLARAFQDPAVAAAFSALRDSVVAAILRIDPGAQLTMDSMAEIEARVAEIEAEMARLSP